MKITVLGETVAMEGTRLIRKEVKVYTLSYSSEETYDDCTAQVKVYHNPKVVIDRIINKTFEGTELENYVEVNLNMVF